MLLSVLMVGCATLLLARRCDTASVKDGFHAPRKRADRCAQVPPPPQDAGQRIKGTCTGRGVMEKKLKTPREVRMLDVFSACIAERASLSASTRVEEQGQMAILRSLLTARRPHLAQKEVSWENGGELKASSHSSHTTARKGKNVERASVPLTSFASLLWIRQWSSEHQTKMWEVLCMGSFFLL